MLAFNIINEYILWKKSLKSILKNFPEFNKNIFKEIVFIVPKNHRTKTSNIFIKDNDLFSDLQLSLSVKTDFRDKTRDIQRIITI